MAFKLFTFVSNFLDVVEIWDVMGTPDFVPDRWNPTLTPSMRSSGMADQIQLLAGPVIFDGETDATIVSYIRSDVAPGSAEAIIVQGWEVLGYPLKIERLGVTGHLRVNAFQNDGGFVFSDIDGALITGKGQIQIGTTIQGDPDGDAIVRIFLNGVEVKDYLNFSVKSTTGFKTFEGNQQFRLGRFSGATMDGEWMRVRAASGIAFDADQMLAQYLIEESEITKIFEVGDNPSGKGPDKNILPSMTHDLPLISGDTESTVFSIEGYRGLGLIVPDTLTGVAGLSIEVSNIQGGTFAPLPIVGIVPGKSYNIGLISPWRFAKIVLLGDLTGSGNIPLVLS